MGIIYAEVNGALLIDGIELYANTFGDVPTRHIDDFRQYRIPTREEVIERSVDEVLESIRN